MTFHLETCGDVHAAIRLARELGLGVGVAFNPETPVEAAAAAAEEADLALCMSIHPGRSGQAFMPEALGRIEELRRLLPPSVRVQVDGGISGDNIRAVHEAGADLLVAGSSIFWHEDPAAAYRSMRSNLEATTSRL